MIHRYLFIATALVSCLQSIESASIRASIPSEDVTKPDEPDWIKAEMTIEKGFKCKAGADKRKMSSIRECEGGFKQVVGAQLSPKELAETVVAAGIADLQSSMMQPNDYQQNLLSEETMEELVRWDTEGELVFEGEDCLEENGGCKKTLEFGGYAKVLWGCNITFSMNGKKVGKDVECGGKSFEGAGSKSKDYYYGDEKSGSAQATAKMMKKKSYPTVPSETIDSEYLPKPSINGHLSAYNLFFRDERAKILAERQGVSYEDQARIVSQRWDELEDGTRDAYRKFAEADAIRYQAELELHSVLATDAVSSSVN